MSMIGELKNTSNKLDKRIMRVLARTPLNNIFFTLYLFFFKKKNKTNYVTDYNVFDGIDDQQKILNNLENLGIFKGFSLKKNITEDVLKSLENQKFFVNREKSKTILLKEKKKMTEFISVDI